MIERRVTIGSPVGLHARPASLFVQKVNQLPFDLTIGKIGEGAVNARSIMSVLSLDIAGGEEIVLASTATEDGAGAMIDDLCTFLATDLDKQ
ncbi:HPr family phosphocarrier protein [Actinomycetes bacterium M1A6_2h]